MKTLEELFHVSATCTCSSCTQMRHGAPSIGSPSPIFDAPIFLPVVAPISRSEFAGLQAENARLRQELADEKQSGIEAFDRWKIADAESTREAQRCHASFVITKGLFKRYGQHRGACPSKPCECGFDEAKTVLGI